MVGVKGKAVRRSAIALLACGAAVLTFNLVSGSPSATAFTGCLSSSGSLSKVAMDTDTPLKPCSSKQTQVSWTSDAPPGPLGLESNSCPTGEAIHGFDANGGLICDTP